LEEIEIGDGFVDGKKYSKREIRRKIGQESRWRIVALPKCLSQKIGEENYLIIIYNKKNYKRKKLNRAVPTQISFAARKSFLVVNVFNKGQGMI